MAFIAAVSIGLLTLAAVTQGKSIENTVNSEYLSLLNPEQVLDIQIILDEADWQNLLDNAIKEEYTDATVYINGLELNHVGVRAKGNSSLSTVASSESNRYSLKLDFDQYVQGQTLLGLEKLNLNNGMSDPSYMREYLSYYILDEMDVDSPAYAFAQVSVNGDVFGFYTAVEDVSEAYLNRVMGDAAGALYKPDGVGSDLLYIDDDFNSYSGIVCKSAGTSGYEDRLIQMLQVLNAENPSAEELEQVLDVDRLLRYIAVNTALVNLDSYAGSMKHNYYLYERNGRFSIIPWDYNMSFAGFMQSSNTNDDGSYLYIDVPVSGTSIEDRPLFGKLLAIDEYKERYHAYLDELLNGVFSQEQMSAKIAAVTGMIDSYVQNDPTAFYSYDDFLEAVNLENLEDGNDEASESSPSEETQDTTVEASSPFSQGDAVAPANPGENPTESASDNAMPIERMDGDAGGRMGVGMLSGKQTPLMTLVVQWGQNIRDQLDGVLPSTGDTGNLGGGMGMRGIGGGMPEGLPGGEAPAGNVYLGEPPAGAAPAQAGEDDKRPAAGNRPEGGMGGIGGMGGNAVQKQSPTWDSILPLLIVSGATLLAILLLWKTRNKHSI